ncbi:MAG: hypothetical protein ACOZFS_07820 [Thermodesulfobacteriota bacterium]
MKLLSVLRARSIWMIYLSELNPRGLYDYSVVRPMIEKYKFLKVPTKIEEFDLSRGCEFKNGSFQKNPQLEIGVDITLYNDGLVVDTRSSTADSDGFLEEFLSWLSTDFGVVPYQNVLRRKFYLSELSVQTDKPLNALNPKLQGFAERINSLISGFSDRPIAFETSGVRFWTDPTVMTNPPGHFLFERLEKVPFNENRYYSAAPLQTEDHLKMLEELEQILS